MTLVSNNIRYLRKRRHYTQDQLAEKIGIKRSLLGAYEEGRADPRLNNLLNIAKIFNVTVDLLISRDITQFSEEELKQAERNGKPGAQDLKVLSITVDRDNNENIELVPQKAAAGYLNGYADPEYLEDLPKFTLPMLGKGGTYRAFEITGDSMLPLEAGSIVIGQYVEHVREVKNGKTYVFLTRREGIVYKRAYQQAGQEESLTLVSDNKSYSPYEIEASEIIEIWEARAFISMNLPGVEKNEAQMSVDKLTSIVMDLQKEVTRLKERK